MFGGRWGCGGWLTVGHICPSRKATMDHGLPTSQKSITSTTVPKYLFNEKNAEINKIMLAYQFTVRGVATVDEPLLPPSF